MIRLRHIIRNIERFIVYRILHADDTPHRLALGIGLGLFVAWTPTIGFQMVIVLLLATMFKANRPVGIPIVWISNPLTLVLIYYPNYLIGRYLLGIFGQRPELSSEQIAGSLTKLPGPAHILQHLFDAQLWKNLWAIFVSFLNFSLDLWVGSIVMGLLIGGIGYIVSNRFIIWYREHYPRRRHRRLLLETLDSPQDEKK